MCLKIRKKIIKNITKKYINKNYKKTNKIPEILIKENIGNAKYWEELPKEWKDYYSQNVEYILNFLWLNIGKFGLLVLFNLIFFDFYLVLIQSITYIFFRQFEKPAINHFDSIIKCTLATIIIFEMPLVIAKYFNLLYGVIVLNILQVLFVEFIIFFKKKNICLRK